MLPVAALPPRRTNLEKQKHANVHQVHTIDKGLDHYSASGQPATATRYERFFILRRITIAITRTTSIVPSMSYLGMEARLEPSPGLPLP